jgi:5-methylcytosine-specific restriction endonuclease McrA
MLTPEGTTPPFTIKAGIIAYFAGRDLIVFGVPRSPEWNSVRREHLIRYPYCAACGTSNDREVHHIIPYHINKELELELSNLLTLCRRCHLFIGHFDNWVRWNKNVVQDAGLLLKSRKDQVTPRQNNYNDYPLVQLPLFPE